MYSITNILFSGLIVKFVSLIAVIPDVVVAGGLGGVMFDLLGLLPGIHQRLNQTTSLTLLKALGQSS